MTSQQKLDAWASDVQRRRHHRKQQMEEFSVRKGALSLLTVLSAFSSVYTAIFLVSLFSNEQFTIKEIAFCVMLFVAFFLGLRFIYRLGFITLPNMEQLKREAFLPFYGVVAAVGIGIAALTSALSVADAPARQHHLQNSAIEISAYAAKNVGVANTIFSQDAAIEGKLREVVTAEQVEGRIGSHCGSGRGGVGPCGSLLKSLAVTSRSALDELRRAEATASPLIDRIEAESEALRMIASESDISYAEKRSRIETHFAQIDLMTRQLQQLVPLGLLESLSSDWTRDYSTAGMTKQGQDRLYTMLSESARVISMRAQEAEHQFTIDALELTTPNIFTLITMYADEMFLLLVIAIFPDLLATAIIIFNFVASDKPMEEDDDLFPEEFVTSHTDPDINDVIRAEAEATAKPNVSSLHTRTSTSK